MVSRSLGAVFALVMLCFLFLSCSVLILNSQHHTGSPYDHRTLNNDQVNPHAGYLNLQLEQFLAKFAKTNPDEFHHLTGRDGAHAAPHISKLTQYSPPTYTKVKLLTRACANIILDEFQLTLETCFAPTSDFHLTSVHHPDLDGSLVCGTTAWKSVDREEVPLDQCPKTEETGWVYVLKGLMLRASSSHQRVMGGLKGLWGDRDSLSDKASLCHLSTVLFKYYNVSIMPPCVITPGKKSDIAETIFENNRNGEYPYWLFKPADGMSNHGLKFIDVAELKLTGQTTVIPTDPGLVQGYMHDTMTIRGSSRVETKLDLRIYGVVTSVQPLRVYVSTSGYYRTGLPDVGFSMKHTNSNYRLVHSTKNAAKIKARRFERIDFETHFQQGEEAAYHPSLEHTFSSAGTLHKFWAHVEEQGMDRNAVWDNILALFAQTHAGAQPWLLSDCASAKVGEEGLCNQEFVPFSADVGIRKNGEVALLEMQPACTLKPCASPLSNDMEACRQPIVTEFGSRPGSWGSTAMGLSRFMDPQFRVLCRQWLEVFDVRWCDKGETFVGDVCMSEEAAEILVDMAQEDFMACRFGMVDAMGPLKGGGGRKGLREELEMMLDEESLAFYEVYEKFELGQLARRIAGRDCKPMWFGHGEDRGCK